MKETPTNNPFRAIIYGLLIQMLCLGTIHAEDFKVQVIESVKEAKITIQLQNASLKECFNEIEKHTSYRFSYDHDLIDNSVRINFRSENKPVSDLLMEISRKADLKFKQINNSINVQKLQNAANETQLEVIIQGIIIIGRVTSSENGEGLPGVNVIIKGTSQGTITDMEGKYTLEVPEERSVLIFSYLGFNAQEVAVGSSTTLDVTLTPDITALEEVVVIGYGTQRKSDLTGAIAGVDSKVITERGVTNPIQSLQGSVAGVQVTNSTGRIGDNFNVTIRGKNTLQAGENEPLYVVNGVITENIDFLNPQDIASIDILKDASSAAIYGSRGSNGVVIIQTRGGANVPDGTNVNFETFYGFRNTARLPEMMSPETWRDYHMSAYLATINPDNVVTPEDYNNVVLPESSNSLLRERFNTLNGFDWYDAVLKPGSQSNSHLSITHRNGGSAYSFGFGYQHEDGNIENEYLKKYTLRSAVDQEIGSKFKVGASLSVSFNDVQQGSELGMREAFRLNPFLSPWAVDANGNELEGVLFDQPGKLNDPNGNRLIDKTSTFNPLLEIANSRDETRQWNAIATNYVQYNPIDWLSLKSTFSAGLETSRRGQSWGARTNRGSGNNGLPSSQLTHFENFNFSWDNQADIRKTFNNHSFNFLALQSIYINRTETSFISSTNQPFDTEFYNVGSGLQSTFNLGNAFLQNQLTSFALRLNYSWQNRYLLTLTNRWDGSSLLAEGLQWNAFPSMAIAWRLSEEPFLRSFQPVSDLKLRVSYGFTGNDNVDPYSSVNVLDVLTFYDFNETPANGYVSSSIANKSLTWEKTSEMNIGLDYSLFDFRITGSVDLYNRLSKELLLEQTLPLETGYSSITANAGSVRNSGLEIMLNTTNISTSLITWETTFTFTKNTNKIESIYGQKENDDIGNGWFIGESIDVHYNYRFSGIWQADEPASAYNQSEGEAKVADLNKDGMITPEDDREIIGSSNPSWTGGIISRLYVGNFDFNFTLFTKQGVLAYSNFHVNFEDVRDRGRQKLDIGEWYVPANTYGVPAQRSNKYPQPRNEGTYWINNGVGYYKNASYLKVSNISVGYSLPARLIERANMEQLRIYVNVLNPFVFTEYTGWDPEWAEASYEIGRVSSITTQLGLSLKF